MENRDISIWQLFVSVQASAWTETGHYRNLADSVNPVVLETPIAASGDAVMRRTAGSSLSWGGTWREMYLTFEGQEALSRRLDSES
jgi:hypothetical protein